MSDMAWRYKYKDVEESGVGLIIFRGRSNDIICNNTVGIDQLVHYPATRFALTTESDQKRGFGAH